MILSKLPRFSGLLISVVLLIQPALSRADLIYNSQPQPYGGEALGYGGAYTALSNESSGLFYNPAMKPQPDGLSLGLRRLQCPGQPASWLDSGDWSLWLLMACHQPWLPLGRVAL